LKHCGNEGGLKVPAAVAWPGHIKPGSRTSQVALTKHHVRHIRKVGGKPVGGFAWLMRLQNRKQVPVCRECHRKIHRGEYDGLRLADLAYRVGP
jgi:hypothetical protein